MKSIDKIIKKLGRKKFKSKMESARLIAKPKIKGTKIFIKRFDKYIAFYKNDKSPITHIDHIKSNLYNDIIDKLENKNKSHLFEPNHVYEIIFNYGDYDNISLTSIRNGSDFINDNELMKDLADEMGMSYTPSESIRFSSNEVEDIINNPHVIFELLNTNHDEVILTTGNSFLNFKISKSNASDNDGPTDAYHLLTKSIIKNTTPICGVANYANEVKSGIIVANMIDHSYQEILDNSPSIDSLNIPAPLVDPYKNLMITAKQIKSNKINSPEKLILFRLLLHILSNKGISTNRFITHKDIERINKLKSVIITNAYLGDESLCRW